MRGRACVEDGELVAVEGMLTRASKNNSCLVGGVVLRELEEASGRLGVKNGFRPAMANR